MPEAFGRCFPAKPVLSKSEDDSGRELGAPVDQTKVWRKLARKRQASAFRIFCGCRGPLGNVVVGDRPRACHADPLLIVQARDLGHRARAR